MESFLSCNIKGNYGMCMVVVVDLDNNVYFVLNNIISLDKYALINIILIFSLNQ